MSWDIGIALNEICFENASWNYTHNCNDMMRDAKYPWVYNLHAEKIPDATWWECS